jgi:type II secretory pathway component PulF
MKLQYTAYDGMGQATTGVVEAGDVSAATEMLRRDGLYVAELNEVAQRHKDNVRRRTRRLSATQNLKNLAMFSRQLHVLISSGTQLVDALRALERQARSALWREVIAGLRGRVEEGASLADAMETYGAHFDPIYRGLVAAGESSGHLVEMLDRLAVLKQRQLKVRRLVVGALIYPCMLVSVGVTIFASVLLFVVPRFAELFESLDVPLPGSTEILVHVSGGLRHYWWLMALVLAAAIGGAVTYLRTPQGRYARDTAALKLPFIRALTMSFATARIVRLLGVLMHAHIPVLEALKLVRHSAGNVRYRDLVAQAEADVARGEPMSHAFSDAFLIDPSVHEMIHSGEQTGELDRLLLNVSAFLDEENETMVRSLTAIIEPVILIAMGLLVGAIAVCMFLPLFDLTSMTQGGA